MFFLPVLSQDKVTAMTLKEDVKTPVSPTTTPEAAAAPAAAPAAVPAAKASEMKAPAKADAPAAPLAAEKPEETVKAAAAATPAVAEEQKPAPKKRAAAKAVKTTNPAKKRAAPKAKAAQTTEDAPAPLPPVTGVPDLDDPLLYINRELNWIEFDRKVLDEACDAKTPLLEQLKFLSIFHNNLDEFFMVRVSNIIRQFKIGAPSCSADGLAPVKQLAEIRRRVLGMLARAQNHWKELVPELAKNGISIVRYKDLTEKQKSFLEGYFLNEIYPILTPQAIDAGHPFPTISNISLNFLVELEGPDGSVRYARLKSPNNMPRFIFVPRTKESAYAELGFNPNGRDDDIILLEDLIREHLGKLFPGHKVRKSMLFRITRNTDLEIEEDEADDLLAAVKDFIDQRRFGDVIRLELEYGSDQALTSFLTEKLELLPFQIFRIRGPLAMNEFMPLIGLDRPALKDPPYKGLEPAFIAEGDVFPTIKSRDVFLYHPYESFNGVLEFIRQAAADPQVVAIKQTLYRCGSNSPIVAALIDARRRGKQVTAVVELKARFDEERNINWAEEMEKAGVNVVYGFVGLKIHAKLCLVVRRESEGMCRYVHISTGNYNPSTAKIYTDYALFTANPDICADVSDLFNVMTGYSNQTAYRELVVSPHSTRSSIIAHIEREIECHRKSGKGEIILKCNQLVDRAVIKSLYAASQAGVKISIIVRGICCLRPGIPGVSENISVRSIVGRFLEHARAYYFRHGGDPFMLIGSADLMPRNLDGRIEVLTPVLDHGIRNRIKATLDLQLADNTQCWVLHSDGIYERITPPKNGRAVDSQAYLAKHYGHAE